MRRSWAAAGKLTLDDDVFGAPFNGPLVHECVVAELAARRRGTHATKTRGMVRGGGAKPWRQKGTGRARAGSSRSPLWSGGGTVFGPSPRHYTVKVNRKARRAALRSVLSLHAERGSLFGVDAGRLRRAVHQARRPACSTSAAPAPCSSCSAPRRRAAAKSFRNLPASSCSTPRTPAWPTSCAPATLVASQAAVDALTARAPRSDRDKEDGA